MSLSPILWRQSHRLLQAGIGLFLFSVLVGLVIPHFTIPRLALGAHLIGILQGIFLVALGLLWPKLRLSPAMSRSAFWLLIYECIAAVSANLLAGAWGAGNNTHIGRGWRTWQRHSRGSDQNRSAVRWRRINCRLGAYSLGAS